ncbi:MAG: DUF2304 domain-containing protein [Chloroflexota bacterium]|nr:DUF2304 domain-containing protein [Chloroflexota bacterium]MDE2854950.1 DUF2304 domain-containing protein [Chloroflexota bacterium]MDE2946810.1 DUF2304 domain-containing protein [Chloroflexota bacterium]
MIDRSTIFMVGASILALLIVLELVRRRHLSEEYSLLWLGTAVAMLVVGIWRDLLHSLAALVNIYHPPNLLFLLAVLFLLFMQLYFSTVITRLTRESKEAAQQIALLRYELSQLRGEQVDSEDDQGD